MVVDAGHDSTTGEPCFSPVFEREGRGFFRVGACDAASSFPSLFGPLLALRFSYWDFCCLHFLGCCWSFASAVIGVS
jgi:hypothetical protein